MSEIKKIEELKSNVEKAAWNQLDLFFKNINPDDTAFKKALICLSSIAAVQKAQLIEINERKLIK